VRIHRAPTTDIEMAQFSGHLANPHATCGRDALLERPFEPDTAHASRLLGCTCHNQCGDQYIRHNQQQDQQQDQHDAVVYFSSAICL
jgi:hypothetical protein